MPLFALANAGVAHPPGHRVDTGRPGRRRGPGRGQAAGHRPVQLGVGAAADWPGCRRG